MQSRHLRASAHDCPTRVGLRGNVKPLGLGAPKLILFSVGSAPPTSQLPDNRHEYLQFQVTVLCGADAGEARLSQETELTVGSSEGNDLRLTDPSVSRHHCAFTATVRGVEVNDLGSTNGTFVNGVRVFRALVPSGATVSIGSSTLRFEGLDTRVSVPVSSSSSFGRVVGDSPIMRRIFAALDKVSTSDVTVLFEGETGTGKSMLAEALHQKSRRAGGPFVTIDCSALPGNIIESELFGHEKGSFSGATEARVGLFEQAAGGTIFLDEVGELPLALQSRLLRFLEKRTLRRVGGDRDIAIDIRVVAATNRDLRREVNRGTVRPDLLYRLNGIRLVVPPLRERTGDIPLLLDQLCRQITGSDEPVLTPDLVENFCARQWPGNVRQLANTVERAVLLGGANLFDEGDDTTIPFGDAKEEAVESFERQYLLELVARHEGNLSAAARAAKMSRNHLYTLLRQHDIAVPGRGANV